MANAPPRVAELIETFDRNIGAYRSQQYNETQLRREFIDPFFEELGWDVTNIAGNAQAYKDVIHEDAIKVGSATKAPDYSFRIGGVRKFFLEAKKPSIDIKGDPHPAYQLRRYAWSAKLPLSILTDFEEFAVYDCQTRPKQTDKAGAARIMYLNYKEYVKRWSDIETIFSKDAILKGSFDKFAVSTKGKRGTTTVDKEFLEEIETWREQLAKIIAHRNRTLTVPQINFAVQRTIDRIIFLRMAEDRGIEQYSQLQAISGGDRNYPRLCELFEKADHKYNSGLFYFQKEPGRPEGPDELTLNLVVDDNPLKYILHSLYYPQCPYEFSVLPPEILGNVYEQFLGKVIRITPGHRAVVEEKPEVKKAGGIYYTPNYIVDYIVKNTVGRLLGDPSCLPSNVSVGGHSRDSLCHSRESEDPAFRRSGNPPRHCEEPALQATRQSQKFLAPSTAGGSPKKPALSTAERSKPLSPKQISNLRILDPACGSGSFLLGAYTYLLNYHRDWYVENNPEKHTKKIYQGKGGQWFLTIAEKKQILLNNIFGVDIDSQAVEVTKLSLLLKVLEGETSETIGQTYKIFHERALPDLGNNIKCGNSLIGPDFFDNLEGWQPQAKPTPGWQPQAKPTPGWQPQAKLGDGNSRKSPNHKKLPSPITEELRRRINPFDYKTEFPQVFKQSRDRKRAVTSAAGGFDIVIGNPPWGAEILKAERAYLSKTHPEVADFESSQYFLSTCVNLLHPSGVLGMIIPNTFALNVFARKFREKILSLAAISQMVDLSQVAVFAGPNVRSMILILAQSKRGKCHISGSSMDYSTFKSLRFVSQKELQSANTWKALFTQETPLSNLIDDILGRSTVLAQYCQVRQGYIPYRTSTLTRRFGRVEAQHIVKNRLWHSTSPKSSEYRKELQGKDVGRYTLNWSGIWVRYGEWVSTYLPLSIFSGPRILIREITKSLPHSLLASYTNETFVHNPSVLAVLPFPNSVSPKFLLGILNSRLMSQIFTYVAPKATKGLFPKIIITDAKRLLFPRISLSNHQDKSMHDKMVKLVDRILNLHKRLAKAKVPAEKTRIQRQINTTDKQIDKLVYELYNLTEEEIAIVEDSNRI